MSAMATPCRASASAYARQELAQLARAFVRTLDRRPVTAARQDDDAAAARAVQLLGEDAHLLRRRDAVLVAGDEQHRRFDAIDRRRLRLGERLAGAGVAVRVLTHQALADERDGER